MRRYERDSHGEGWHDSRLMELIAGEESLGDVAEIDAPVSGA
jgi:hypothetical protein